MLSRDITYTDYNGEECTEKLYFHLSKPEIVKLDAYYNGFMERLDELKASRDAYALYEMFEKILLDSYGVKTDDGKRFMKSAAISEAFSQSPAYEALFMQLVTDDNFLKEFMTSLGSGN